MDFHPLQLGALGGALVAVNVWAHRRLAVPSQRDDPRQRAPVLAVLAVLALVAFGYTLVTIASEDGFLLAAILLPVQLVWLMPRFFRYNRWRGRPVSWRRLLFGNLLVLLVPLSLALLLGELWFRFVRDTTDSIGYTKVARRWHERHYSFNNFDYRDNVDYVLDRVGGSHRVSFVGDSFTAGHGIADVDQRVGNRIRRRHPQWEVHVLARDGHDTEAETSDLKLATAHGYVVDEVVLMYCLNDVMDLLPEWQRIADDAADRANDRLPLFDSSYLLDTVYYRLVIARVPGIGDYFSFVGEAYRGERWQQQRARLRSFRAVVEAAGGRLSVVTWPFLNAVGPDYPHAHIHERLNEFWQGEGVQHLDLLPHLRGHSAAELVVNSADAHPNEFASELAVTAIDPWLAAIVGSPKPGR